MNISKMNKRIILKGFKEVKNKEGVYIKQWTHIGSVWAFVKPMSGSQVFIAQATEHKNIMKINIRYNKIINENMRVEIDGIDYNITYIEDVDFAHQEMWLTLEKVI